MMADEIVSRARSWIGTPFVHQGRSRMGVDCMGVAINALGMEQHDRTNYSLTPNCKQLTDELERHLIRVHRNEVQPGDLLRFNIVGSPQHFGIFVGDNKFVHAHMAAGKTVENTLDAAWKRRLISAYRHPEITCN